MQEIMEWAWKRFGDDVYKKPAAHVEAINLYLEQEEIELNPKNKKQLLSVATWKAQKTILEAAEKLAEEIGDAEYLDFNEFKILVNRAATSLGLELSSFEFKQILGAVSLRDGKAAKVIKKFHELSGKKLAELVDELGTTQEHLADYGYWPGDAEGEYIEYETDSELRDTENVPLGKDPKRAASEVIHDYFVNEVRPHVADAWIDLDKTVIGYEISFNKYFYQHKELRRLEEVSAEIIALESETKGMLRDLVKFVGKKP